ncbi:MAG: DNA-protecting protein DprA [Candidatus Omnitrophica bacterium]|nr:DNA-protecting protein DprA [Candidatus Omnitrophota bacterium]
MKTADELVQVVALSLVENLGPVTFKKLVEEFGSVQAVWEAGKRGLSRLARVKKIAANVPRDLGSEAFLDRAAEEIKTAGDHGVEIVTFFDARYPADLKEIFDPPILLYVQGDLPEEGLPEIAVIGSREASLYGARMARSIARGLAAAGAAVVSGMARGVDSQAHEGALEADGVTVAVLGGGLSRLYPPENRRLAARIAKKGAVISEYPMRRFPEPGNFPVRNRIISGLSRAVVVVEAREKSGALITVDAALEQGRDVFAVPGNADSARSRGTNRLLKQGAKLAESAEDILEELGLQKIGTARAGVSGKQNPRAEVLTEAERSVLSFFDSEPLSADELVDKSGLAASQVVGTLLSLEMKRRVRKEPGNFFVKR